MESYGDLSFEPRYNIAPSQSVPVIVRNEDRRDGKRKMPMWIQLKKREPFAFAGLWDCWQDRDSEIELYTFTIIMTRPNALLRPIHDRMPVIYDAGMGRHWLDPRCTVSTSKTLAPILQPLPSDLMEPTWFQRSSIRRITTRRLASSRFRPVSQVSGNCLCYSYVLFL